MIKIELTRNKPLAIVFFVMIILFLLSCVGALWITMEDGGMMGSGWQSGISWMWIPTLLFLTLSILVGWVIYSRNKNIT